MPRPATNKREKLISAAIDQYHQQGVVGTSLSDIAKAADIPVGNVFYYFKAKDELTRAVVDTWCQRLTGYLADLAALGDPWRQLHGFVDQALIMRGIYTQSGCPLAGLSRDLRQSGDVICNEASRTYAIQKDWLSCQFLQAGASELDATSHAQFCMASLHGSFLLSHATGDDSFIATAVTNIKVWLDAAERGADQSTNK